VDLTRPWEDMDDEAHRRIDHDAPCQVRPHFACSDFDRNRIFSIFGVPWEILGSEILGVWGPQVYLEDESDWTKSSGDGSILVKKSRARRRPTTLIRPSEVWEDVTRT